jgi:EAL domain-containing protein (putative c-di-GMP-specific phosphodiesterase class I)
MTRSATQTTPRQWSSGVREVRRSPYLKVDVDFVRDLATNRDNQHLVSAIVGLARDFGYETIAEGVEDADTLALVKEYGVNFAQGFHLGRPAPIDR